jgi:hypothetical protein
MAPVEPQAHVTRRAATDAEQSTYRSVRFAGRARLAHLADGCLGQLRAVVGFAAMTAPARASAVAPVSHIFSLGAQAEVPRVYAPRIVARMEHALLVKRRAMRDGVRNARREAGHGRWSAPNSEKSTAMSVGGRTPQPAVVVSHAVHVRPKTVGIGGRHGLHQFVSSHRPHNISRPASGATERLG